MAIISRHLKLVVVLTIIFVLLGCQSKETITEAPPLPKTLEEVVQYPVGMFKSQDGILTDAAKKQLALFPTLSEEAGDDELMDLYAHIYSLVKSDYEDPIEILEMVTNEKTTDDMEQPQQEAGSLFE